MTIKELIESGRMNFGDTIDYHPDVGKFIANPSDTGISEVQVLETQHNAEFVLWDYDTAKRTVKLTTKRFVNPIIFFGIKGYFNGPNELHRLCETNYSSEKLQVKARSMTIEDYTHKYGCKVPSCSKRTTFWSVEPDVGFLEYEGKKYTALRTPSNSKFYSADRGGVLKVDDDGFKYRVPEFNKPVYITESYFHHSRAYDSEKLWDAAWLASPCIRLFDVCGEVLYCLRSFSSGELDASLLFNSNDCNNVRASNGVHPIITLSSQTLINEQREVGEPWKFA